MYCLEEKLERQAQSGLMGSTAGAAGEALLRDYSQTLWTMYGRYREVKGQPTFMSQSRNQASLVESQDPGKGEAKEIFSLSREPNTSGLWVLCLPSKPDVRRWFLWSPQWGSGRRSEAPLSSEASRNNPPTIKHTTGKYFVVLALVSC